MGVRIRAHDTPSKRRERECVGHARSAFASPRRLVACNSDFVRVGGNSVRPPAGECRAAAASSIGKQNEPSGDDLADAHVTENSRESSVRTIDGANFGAEDHGHDVGVERTNPIRAERYGTHRRAHHSRTTLARHRLPAARAVRARDCGLVVPSSATCRPDSPSWRSSTIRATTSSGMRVVIGVAITTSFGYEKAPRPVSQGASTGTAMQPGSCCGQGAGPACLSG